MMGGVIQAQNEQPRFSYDDMFAAMCIMEEIADPQMSDAGTPWAEYRERVGTNELRGVIIDRLAGPCDAAWDRAQKRYEEHLDSHTDDCEASGGTGVCTCEASRAQDPGSFDYEFVPFWLRECVDWSDLTAGPRVRGSQS